MPEKKFRLKWILTFLKNFIIYQILIGFIILNINSIVYLWTKDQSITFSTWKSNIFTSGTIKISYATSMTIVLILSLLCVIDYYSDLIHRKKQISSTKDVGQQEKTPQSMETNDFTTTTKNGSPEILPPAPAKPHISEPISLRNSGFATQDINILKGK